MSPRRPLVHGGTVVNGKIVFDQRRLFGAALPAWNGTRVTVTIAEEVPTRSLRQNAFLFGPVYGAIAEASGYSVDDVHELMKMRHNSKIVVDPFTGEEQRIAQSTAKLPAEKFTEYIERCMVDGAEQFGISFAPPRPGEDYR